MARRKPFTARICRITMLEFGQRTRNDQPGAGQRDVTDMLALSDDGCAKVGIAKVANLLKLVARPSYFAVSPRPSVKKLLNCFPRTFHLACLLTK